LFALVTNSKGRRLISQMHGRQASWDRRPAQDKRRQAAMTKLSRLAINDEGFVFDPSSGESFTVNSTGLDILKELKEDRTQEDIADILARRYGVNLRDAERDVADFTDRLRTFQLI